MDGVCASTVDQTRVGLLRQMPQAKRDHALVSIGELGQESLAAQITSEVALALEQGRVDLLELLFDYLVKVGLDPELVGQDHAIELHGGIDGAAALSTGRRSWVC